MIPQAEQPSIFTHRNHYLFADYYLDRRVGDQREWQEADVGQVFAAVTQLWRRFKPQGDNEAQTEADWIRPVLSALGHRFNVQVGMKTPLGTKVPDYVFYSDEPTRLAAKGDVLTESDFRDALAVGDAKAWERSLDRAAPCEAKTLHENPSLQIDTYIRHSGLAWGILTNGRLWRLCHKDTSKKLDVYYEVDLPALIAQHDAEAFKYFWLFFRREAFLGDAQTPAWLDRVLAESRAYEQGVSANLKEQIYDALRCLAQGFLDFPYNGLTPTAETLRAIHDNSLIVLYRLLFMLYAEARELLPVRENRLYAEGYSLHALKQRIARDLDRGLPAAASMSGIWQELYELWRVINTGDVVLGVPAYNGGLFRPENHSFIERYRVGDLYLRQAIDLLARAVDPATGHREFVDYRDLEIRHLGSIYEGLLEYQVRHAAEPLMIVRQNGKETYAPASPSPSQGEGRGGGQRPPDIQIGQLYLVTDKGERKATGSYYTPDYIVQYIVEQAVGPILEARTATFRQRGGQITDEAGLVKAVLGVNVLDPAMGSGHFLVAATDFVARHLVGLGLTTISGSDGEGELAYWRRRVAQSCIYGVDLNPLAVELAKLGLWLATVSKDKPLSFLDHHLRCGNSLIGARVADLPLGTNQVEQRVQERRAAYKVRQVARKEEAAREAGQLTMLDDSAFAGAMHTASGMMTLIEELGSETLADVHRAEQVYRESVRAVTEKARLLADIWTARHFDLALDDTIWGGLARYVLHGGFEMPQYKAIIEQGRGIADDRHFFHWELEFPEVFFDGHGRLMEDAGFEAVIGNPPYGADFDALDKAWLRSFRLVEYQYESYIAFIERATTLLARNGRNAFIVPDSWLNIQYARELRRFFLFQTTLESLVDLPQEVFRDATVDPMIYVSLNSPPPTGFLTRITIFDHTERLQTLKTPDRESVKPQSGLAIDADCRIRLGRSPDVLSRQEGTGRQIPLGSLCTISLGCKPYQEGKGIPPQTNEVKSAKPFNASARLGDDYYPFYLGGGAQRYHLLWHGEWIRYGRHLAEPRDFALFTEPRIIVQGIRNPSLERRLVATAIMDEAITNDNLTTIKLLPDTLLRMHYILALLNSRFLNWFYIQQRGTFTKITAGALTALPIRRISFTTPVETRAALADEARRLAATAVESNAPGPMLTFFAAQLAVQPERSDVIHDLLAHLAEQMIALNEQRQAEMKSFLGWLGRESGARLAAFTGRTRLQNYLGDYQRDEPCLEFDDLLDLLKNNQRKLTIDPSRRAFQDRLRAEYAASLAVLLPIKHRLAVTDRLIDRVVYVLYGLTEEEIAIVEGRAAATG